ncbi:hypothetical protein F4819DRAFT_261298 [Hypoxylon fuscum]|nr:hypothetical protein F4819DRAFT_261298 [Hypoxylon fuscum]
MVVKLDPQTSLEPFGLPWSSCHARRADDDPALGNSSRSRYFRISASAPTSPPSVFQVLKGASGSAGDGSTSGGSSGSQNASRRPAIQVEIERCTPRSTSLGPSNRPKPKKSNSAPVVLQSQSGAGDEGKGESDSSSAPPSPRAGNAQLAARRLTAAAANDAAAVRVEAPSPKFCFTREPWARTSTLALRPAKRGRASHDVDGPGTGNLPCKKRRLRLHLVTSRLSQPYSWPATHILNRESGDDSPMLSRFLKFAAMGALRKAGHQSALVRKAAILNRVRINVRQAAVLRGHTVIAGMAARGNSLSHGLQLVTTSNSATGARFPGQGPSPPYDHPYPIPPVWRPHTTAFHPPQALPDPIPHPSHQLSCSTNKASATATTFNAAPNPDSTYCPPPPSLRLTSPPTKRPSLPPQPVREEEEDVAFPSPDLETRYADYSDDDLDDVYADFGVLFGPGARSPEGGSGGSGDAAGGEHFYEEYLDELDGIRWLA